MAQFLVNPFDEADRLAQDSGSWIVASVDPRMSWPTRKQVITYEDRDYVLLPQSNDETAGIALRADRYGLDGTSARRQIMRFCSALCWAESAGIEIIAWGGGNLPRPIHARRGRSVVEYLETDHLPHIESNKDKAVLALYREGMSLDNPFYAFLSLYKTISVVFPKGEKRAKWIAATLGNLDDHHAKARRDQLLTEGVDVGQYIWDEGRNAIAHAEREPYINPDEVDDHFRLQQDLPLLKNLAELAIEQQTGLRRSLTIWRDHLYELQGFRAIIPEEILEKLQNSEPVPEGTTIDIPERYTVIARRGVEFHAFEDMLPEIVGQVEGGMALDFVTLDGSVRIRTILNFLEERLHFDPIDGIAFKPDRDDQQHVSHEISLLEFQRCILSNGRLEIWNPESETMLGRSETCIPVNCFVNHEFYESELAKLNELLEK